ncbi:hypothetical protein CAPTEDRAFT_200998 [Capitella teleta]|uniref:Uncharacterized protein n=1 Tax=Capitella teleta TaxID=283909 RepID=R7T3J0_CAPTE|nr:hypothetical protein CAPTEDRAFT_200998 [Capitella teleta]|eukprot:ELT87166.1 hypothetical protein CAPTEDRAFT_200998 [Capitella teleta]
MAEFSFGKDKVLSRKSVCQLYEKDANIQRNTLVNIFNCPRPSQSSNDITLVTQLTSDRIDRLLLIMNIWKGPISASVYPDTELSIRGEDICLLKKQDSRCRVQLHLVQKSGVFFPVNKLRNIALDMAVTSHVFLTDVDFIPDQNLYENALQQLHSLQGMQSLVIPAFEMIEMKNLVRKEDLPSGKPELLNWWQKGIVQPFQ